MNKILPITLAVSLAAALPAAPAAAQASTPTLSPTAVDPASLALAHQILDIGIPVEKRSQMFASLMDSVVDQARKSTENLGLTKDKDFKAIVDRSTQRIWDQMKVTMDAALPDIFENMARAYARAFSREDLIAMLAFVKTPAGQHFFERSPLILKDPDVQAANQRMMAKVMTKWPEIMRQNMQDIQDYVAKKTKPEDKKPVT